MSQNQGSLSNIWVCTIRFSMAAILNSKMVIYTELNQIPEVNKLNCLKSYFISVFSVTSYSTYKWVKIRDLHISVYKIHGMAAILNFKMAASWTESSSRRKWIGMLEIRHILAFLVTCSLHMSQNQWSLYFWVCKIHIGTYIHIGGHFEFQDGGILNWIKAQKKMY